MDGSAERDQDESFSRTYVIHDTQGAFVGYFSILCDAIRLQNKERPEGITYGSAPAIKLGRMGVDGAFRGEGREVGRFILLWVIGFARSLAKEVGVRYITLDALPHERLVKWYEANAFVRNEGERVRQKIVREVLSRIGKEVELPHVSMRYDILLEQELRGTS